MPLCPHHGRFARAGKLAEQQGLRAFATWSHTVQCMGKARLAKIPGAVP